MRQALLIGVLGVALTLGWYVMIRMPGESYHGPLPPATDELRALEHELRSHVDMLAGEIGERNVFHYPQLAQAAEYIGKTLSETGYEVARQEYDVSGQICENLEAEVRGTERPDEIVLIGAHYDSVKGSPGANDNATGVAAMLALARAFSQTPASRTLRFVAFTNEEPPFFRSRHMGSRVYAKRSRQRTENIILMLSLETIGYYSDEQGSQSYVFPLHFFYPSTGNFIAFVSNVENGSLVRHLIKSFRQHASFPSEGGALWGWLPGVGWSDHWAFWKEGFPAVMVTDTALFRDSTYHTSSDTPKNIHYEHFARVVSGLQRVINEFAQSPEAAEP
ncbi:MAG: M28 family peptidase [Nitrospirales bacterium]